MPSRRKWRAAAGDLEALIAQSGVDKRSYSSKHPPNWLNKVGEWSGQETQDHQLPKELDKFRQSVLLEKTKKGEPPRHALFTAIDELFDEPFDAARPDHGARAQRDPHFHSTRKAPARRAGA